MIDDFVTSKALLDKTQAFADLNGYRLAVKGAKFIPETIEIYLQEAFLPNKIDSTGVGAESSDRQDPIYQLDIYTPKGQGAMWSPRTIVNLVKAEFPKYTFVVNTADQKVQIDTVSATEMPSNASHNRIMIQIDLTVLATNT